MNSKLSTPSRHRMITNAATRLHRRRGLSRHWLAQARPHPAPGRSSTPAEQPPEDQRAPALSPHASRITHHVLSLFVSFVYFVVSLPAATITGNLQTTSGNPYATNALFAPLSTPLASGTSLIASTPTNVVAAADGSFSVVLKQGNYLVTIGGLRRDSVLISVPNDANTYNLNSLITNVMTFNFPYSPIYEQRANKGQTDGYVGLLGKVMTPAGLTASNFSAQGTVNHHTAWLLSSKQQNPSSLRALRLLLFRFAVSVSP